MLEVSPSTVSTNLTVKTLLFLKNFKSHSYQPDNLYHQSSLLNINSFVAKVSSRFPLLHSSIKTQNHIQIQNTTKLKMANEIWIVPFIGQGHLFPLMELCKQLASRNFKAVFVISSNLSSSVPSSLRQFPLVQIAEIPDEIPPPLSSGSSPLPQPSSGPPRPHHDPHNQMGVGLEKLLSTRYDNPDSAKPVCAVLDIMTGWTAEIFKKFGIPTVAFFTSGACSAAMEYAMWKAQPLDIKFGETRLLPGLPEEMALTLSDLKQHSRGPPLPIHGGSPPPGAGAGFPPPGPPPSGHGDGPPLSLGGDFPPHALPPPLGPGVDFPPHGLPPPFEGPGQKRMGPPKPGGRPPWLDEADRSIALMINTCDDLERPFIEYLAKQIGKPVWGVGPLLPEQYWKSDGSILRDGKLRTSNRRSNVSEDEVIEWLDSKSNGSVLYVSFGSEVGPTVEEFSILAEALEASNRPFIWAVQSGSGRPPGPPSKGEEGYFPHGLDGRVGKRGLIIHGWAPQLLILSHPSTGGFLSHCGWNSTVEAIGRGVPFLAWPIRGDQYHDAKLVVSFLKVGYLISDDISEKIKKDDIVKGIEKLMGDEDMKQRAVRLSAKFEHGFPTSSVAALDAFRDFVAQKAA